MFLENLTIHENGFNGWGEKKLWNFHFLPNSCISNFFRFNFLGFICCLNSLGTSNVTSDYVFKLFLWLVLVILDIDKNSFSQNKSNIFYKNLTKFILIKND
jgi:hypothetical protein